MVDLPLRDWVLIQSILDSSVVSAYREKGDGACCYEIISMIIYDVRLSIS